MFFTEVFEVDFLNMQDPFNGARVGIAHALRDSSVDEVEILDAHPTGLRLDLFNATSDQAIVNPIDHRALSFRGSPAQIF